MIAPPSFYCSCWRVFGGGLSAEVSEHNQDDGVCSYVLKGPDGKVVRQGAMNSLASALRVATDLLCQLSEGDCPAAA